MNTETKAAVLITRASSGIGKTTAIALDKLGFQVFAGVRKPEDGEMLKQLAPLSLTPLIIDVTDRNTISAACETVANAVGEQGLYGLVNNAGIFLGGAVELIPLEDLRQQLEVNVIGQVAMIQAFLPLLRKARGRVVNISSIAGILAFPFAGAYCASKFALSALTDSLRVELQPWKIPVVLIEPGIIDTPIWEKMLNFTDQLTQKLPPKTLELYSSSLEKVKSATLKAASNGIAPEQVAKVVALALTAQKPKTRYLVGPDAYLSASLNFLPDRMRDWLFAKPLGLR